jgi:hypothetical protein
MQKTGLRFEFAPDVREKLPCRSLLVPIDQQEDDRHLAHQRDQRLEQRHRRPVGGMKIIPEDGYGPGGGKQADILPGRLGDACTENLRLQVSQPIDHLLVSTVQDQRKVGKEMGGCLGRNAVKVRPEDRAQRCVQVPFRAHEPLKDASRRFVSCRPLGIILPHFRPVPGSAPRLAGLTDNAALSHAGLALQRQQSALPPARMLEQLPDAGQFR